FVWRGGAGGGGVALRPAGGGRGVSAARRAGAHRGPSRGGCAPVPPGGAPPRKLLRAPTRQFEPLDVRLARETYLEALSAALLAGRLALGGSVREVAVAARAAPRPPRPARAPDLLLDGLALMITEGYPAAVPLLKQAVSAF